MIDAGTKGKEKERSRSSEYIIYHHLQATSCWSELYGKESFLSPNAKALVC